MMLAEKYLRDAMMPHMWCPGCGHGIILQAVIRAIDKAGLEHDKTVIVSGIGCSSRASGYMNFDTLHTTHGRALPFASGIKMANPDLNVIVLTGDGDALAIGGNHFIHACRRNIDITTVIFNNSIYGMTSGQYSPMTPVGQFATTSPYGNIDRNFDVCELAKSAGATYVARSTAYHAPSMPDLIVKAINNKGFSVVEAVGQCPTYYGRRNKLGSPVDMLNWQKEHAVNVAAAAHLTPEQLADKLIIGELHNSSAPEFTEKYDQLVARLQGRE
ncbi:MAG TPA: 2-oxoacid:ferredoxin oxidoreductase subunit beta [Firmicutes bacterium]|jgi:2-oxoglutarate ferredoxin oxidoreductase subunit beta|nr:2-oxoacid:ferredoxin oxidoreductase subunit beta [Bacillota bacterium]